MAAIELYNHTKYPDAPLYKAALFAKRIMKVKGDVCVVVRYHAHSSGYLGIEYGSTPSIFQTEIHSNKKKFLNRFYRVKREQNAKNGYSPNGDNYKQYATKDGQIGWFIVRVPKPKKGGSYFYSAAGVLNTLIHEMRHVWQDRNKGEALRQWGLTDGSYDYKAWNLFQGYTGQYAYKRVAHRKRMIEKDVVRAIEAAKVEKHPKYSEVVEELGKAFTSEETYEKAKKAKSTVKYNKYGERMSDYRNVKMKTLRSGDKIVSCPHCGEQAVVLPMHQDDEHPTYTHIAAIDSQTMRWSGYPASECRTTQYGHVQNSEGNWINITFGYSMMDRDKTPEELGVFKTYNENLYRG